MQRWGLIRRLNGASEESKMNENTKNALYAVVVSLAAERRLSISSCERILLDISPERDQAATLGSLSSRFKALSECKNTGQSDADVTISLDDGVKDLLRFFLLVLHETGLVSPLSFVGLVHVLGFARDLKPRDDGALN